MQLSPLCLLWLSQAALHQIEDGPASEATQGATALHQLLRGTPAEAAAHQLLHCHTNARHAADAITEALTKPESLFPS